MTGWRGWIGSTAMVLVWPLSALTQGMAGLEPSGQHEVGVRAMHWVDETRRDPADPGRARELMAWVWYPASEPGTPQTDGGLDPAWAALHEEVVAAKIGREGAELLRRRVLHATVDAPVINGASLLPVLLFMPGLGWLPPDYSALLEDLASHGYVVVAVAPTGLADVVRFPDGRVVRRSLGIGEKIGVDQLHAHDDARFALRQVRALHAGASGPFAGRLDLNRVGALGHSLGGTTSLALAAGDTTVRAALNLDGDPMGAVLEVRPRQPILLISSETPPMTEAPPSPSAEHAALTAAGLERSERRRTDDWRAISSASLDPGRVRIRGARHSNFLDAALVEALVTEPKSRWMRFGPIDGARGIRVATALTRDFFDRVLGEGAEPTRQADQYLPEVSHEATGPS